MKLSVAIGIIAYTLSVNVVADVDKGLSCYNEKNYSCALAEFTSSADAGSSVAQYQLGLLYSKGQGVKQDYVKAVEWYQKAANQGDEYAQFNLGLLYSNGQGVKQDYLKAAEWYQKVADKGYATAQFNLGLLYSNGQGVKQDYVKAAEWYQKAADKGYATAQFNLGVLYNNGQGVKQDYLKAAEWYQKAADQGYANAQYNLGLLYDNGRGVRQDYLKAAEWYQKAADQGYANAQTNLGVLYEFGQGVKQDDLKAAEWYQKAADQGHSNAKENLANLNHRLNCKKSASTEIFGIAIKCANRDQLMAAVKNAGASVIREDKNKWGDVYNSSSVLKGSSEFHINYTVDDRFAKAYYIFPSYMDANQITMVRDFVANKYGNPNSSKGNVSLGNASFEWHLKDGIILTVSRGWPDTTTYLNFTYPKNYQEMMNEQERQRKESEAKQYEKQNNAF